MKKMSVVVAPRPPYSDVDFSSFVHEEGVDQLAEHRNTDPDEERAGQQRPPGSVPVRKVK